MVELGFAVPGDWATATGGYAYDRRVADLLPGHGIAVRRLSLPRSLPNPDPADLAADLAEARRILAATPRHGVLLIDGLAYGALPGPLIDALATPVVALVHHPLAFETGLPPARRLALLASERQALWRASAIVATSATTAAALADAFAISPNRITVAEPGTDRARRAIGTGTPPRILAVGALVPRKGYGDLVEALARLAGRPWQAAIVGSTERDPACAAALRRQIDRLGLSQRIALAGEIGDAALEAHYHAADLFVLASHYEGYGMVLAEAMAHGLAIVTTTGGAAASTVADAAAVKLAPGDIGGLADAIARLLAMPAERHALAAAAWRAAKRLPRWADTAARLAQAIKAVAPR